eukprot:1818867-Pyramimonas_sp.AAC.1
MPPRLGTHPIYSGRNAWPESACSACPGACCPRGRLQGTWPFRCAGFGRAVAAGYLFLFEFPSWVSGAWLGA